MSITPNTVINGDCLEVMKEMEDNNINFTLTDIPYGAVNRSSNGLRKLNKDKADILTFNTNTKCPKHYTEQDRGS